MKHLKIYEEIRNKEIDEYGFNLNKITLKPLTKKYFIFYNFQGLLILSEITSNNKNTKKNYWKHLEYINAKTGESLTNQKNYELTNKKFRNNKTDKYHIVYESDELKDCLDYIDILRTQNKFNL